MFQVSQHIDFCYGHRLLNYAGKCRNLHGHNGRAVIVLASEHLDSRGMLMDFSDIKKVVRTWIDEQLDHRMILHENDPALAVPAAARRAAVHPAGEPDGREHRQDDLRVHAFARLSRDRGLALGNAERLCDVPRLTATRRQRFLNIRLKVFARPSNHDR